MKPFNIRSLLLAAFVLSNCINWTTSRHHHHAHNVTGHRSRHRRQGAGLFLSASYVIPGGEGHGWGEWGEVSPCSRTCGGGVASQKRICLQIGPDGQPQCSGGDTKFFSCQTQDCPAGSTDFRAEQCSEYDDIAFRNIKYRWVPYTKAQNPCELNCMPHGERFYYRHKTKVVDGTRCNDESFDVCVNGTCQPVGCDMMLGSSAREDKCRECRGNGANCRTNRGVLDTQEFRQGYNDVLLIPEGATTIIIEELADSDNYLALRAKNGTYYLNGDYHIDFPRSLVIAGALWYYERSQQGFAAPDKLRCLGPTNEPLILSLLLQGQNVGIQYEYSLPTDLAPPTNKRYNWVHEKFTPCSASCGGGFQTRTVSCRSREELEVVDEGLCDAVLKPPTNQTCNPQDCAPEWTPGPWGQCSKRCGEGGSRSREVHCQKIRNGYPSLAQEKECFDLHGPKPVLYENCNENATCPIWFTGPWKPCNKLCDEGKQTRQVVCYQKIGGRVEIFDDEECEDEKPEAEQSCMLQPCDGVDWTLSEWSGCDSCLSKVRTRTATCLTKNGKVVNESFCSYHSTPVTEEPCDKTKLPACEVQWYATQWSKCSVECGKGLQSRKVFCGLFDGASVLKVDDGRCSNQTKYNETKPCEVPKEKCPSQWFAGPWSACSEKCGGGEQFRRVFCLRGGETATDCDGEEVLDTTQPCNIGPCNKDELLPLDDKSTPIMDDYDDCDEEEFEEVGLDAEIDEKLSTLDDMMLSDGPSTFDGSGMWTSSSYAEIESRFTDTETTLSADELLTTETEGSGSGFSTLETFITDESTDGSSASSSSDFSTDSTTSGTEITSSGTSEGSTESAETGSTESTVSEATDSTITDETTLASTSNDTEVTGETTEGSSVSEGTNETSEGWSVSEDTSETTTGGSTESTVTDEIGSTSSTESTESTLSSESSSESEPSVSDLTTETGFTESTITEETSETGSTETSEGTTETSEGTTETSEVTTETSEGTTEISEATTETSEGTTETSEGPTETSEGTTEISGGTSTASSESESTDLSTTEGTTESGSTEATSESGSTSETATEVTTETGSIDASESTVSEGSTETSLSSESEGSTTESGSTTVTEETGSTESTEFSSTATSEAGSTESTEPTENTSEISTEVPGSTESTEFSTTLSSEGTESTAETSESSESSTTESSEGTTPWDVFTTTKKARVCRPRSCLRSQFGCCPDKKTAALGPFDDGCPKPETCKDTKYGCCPDEVSPATGPDNKGCPVPPCNETLFGCCSSDNKTAAEGNDQEGCPPPPPACMSSKYGCCADNETEATGPKKKGCPESTTPETKAPAGTTAAPSPAGCADSEYGCCFDNKTPAEGPDQQGCPCTVSEYGCCPDGVQPAEGPQFEGCPKSCNSSTYGCCVDGKTPAHGPDMQGCCLLYPYGCCPDNYKPAEGPHLEGCGCEYAPYGCCPNNATIASGPNNKGCGCEYSEHGCCPDRHTEASGPDFEGCLCHTYQFGCCPDGVTISRGPGGQGCHCQQSKFGCCGDEQTHAVGANQQGCDCSTSKYGCCPDGVSEATGPKFLGCSDIPENKQASCKLAFARGPCRNYSVYWYFDNEYGGCSRFWYGGCEGNGNRFVTKEECEDNCVSPPPKESCKLPQSKGACLGYNVRWYYDNDRDMCSNFVYGGCLGNNNNFETREACQAQCEPEKSLDQCNLSIERGTCAGNYPRWGFDKQTRRCEQFIWGGCEGNTNRFSTEAACMQRCNPPGEPKPECLLAQDTGNCSDVDAVWAFSQTENRCLPFYYTGCGGNDNRFYSLDECQDSCPSAYVPDMCTLPAETGDCANYREKWYFDTKDQRCRQFYYGGCGGNSNNFNTEQECSNRCTPLVTTTTAAPQYITRATRPTVQSPSQEKGEMFCFLPLDPGPCNTMTARYGYDYTTGKCVTFQYGGCGGNRNNFPDEQYCQFYCKPAQDVCQLPMSTGPCEASQMMWFYDAASDSCSQFTYGGCEGNDNRFESREACESRCKTAPEPAPAPGSPAPTTVAPVQPRDELPSECLTSDSLEECSPQTAGEVWYFYPHAQQCVPHENLPTGSNCRNSGVFRSQEACERSCGVFRNLEVCRYGVDPGSCKEFVSKYHFNATSGRCEEFAYGGCLGGPNRFSTIQECEDICLPSADPCKQPPEPGNCLARYVLWYYDEERDACNQFIYGGCGGNQNKFESRENCERRCRKRPGEVSVTTTTTPAPQEEVPEECVTPASLAPCGNNVTAFYYDTATSSCRIADIGSCRYSNRYKTEEECERRCGAFRGIDVCRAQLDAGPCRAAITKYYFDASSGSCQVYSYGGCQGGPNRFSTADECKEVCGDAGPAAACLEPVDTGSSGCGASPERRWHYSVLRGGCIVFAFQGCGGTRNNFRSYGECADVCAVTSPETDDSSKCDRYSEECQQLEQTCAHGMTVSVAAEGCERCACAAPPDCTQHHEACQRLECKYGVDRRLSDDGCEQCTCIEDPCANTKCSSKEKCVAAAYRNTDTQEIQYSANCVPDEDTNEVTSECEEAAAACEALRCAYGVQRTRVPGDCERCACVTEDVDCAQLAQDCERLKCTYGMARTRGSDGCDRCSCLEHPCSNQQCPEGERCVATPYRDPVSQETKYSADCRTVNKAGTCPTEGAYGVSSEASCRRECNDDADCRGVGKCCARGCSFLCLVPALHTTTVSLPQTPYTTLAPDVPQAPQSSTETEPEVTASEGGKATLRCIFHGNPPPKITWKRGEITIDGDVGRYRLLSDGALEIVSLYRNDSGVYICVGDNGLGVARQEIRLIVSDPVETSAGISGEQGATVRGEWAGAAVLRCLAYGYPEPSVYWYRGINGPLVPFSTQLYEYVERGRALLVRRLTAETLGEYACLAYNGQGKPATWLVVLQAYQPENEYVDSPYIVPREQVVEVTPPRRITETTTGTTPAQEIELQPFVVPVHTAIIPSATSLVAGRELSLPCEVDGYPEPQVTWTKDNIRLLPNDRMWITNTRLTIHRVVRNDSGVYACHAANDYSAHESSVQITVTEPYVPAKCIDNPYFANCALIVQGKFCTHKYYSRFCCKSCVEAGQLDPSDIEMQGDAPFRKK